jgi:hypothetical protein
MFVSNARMAWNQAADEHEVCLICALPDLNVDERPLLTLSRTSSGPKSAS